MDLHQTCPWCETDIIWDEEIGPEKYCPHCENEISGYRTLELDAEFKDEDDYEDDDEHDADDLGWDEDSDRGILRSTREIAANSVVHELLQEQFEMPECANCREYMIETGVQVVGEGNTFTAKKVAQTGMPLLKTPFKVIWYVCPSCYRTDSFIDLEDRRNMLEALSPVDDM